jgi:hypothetical protein
MAIIGPSSKMKTLAARRLVDYVTVDTRTTVVPTRAQMADGTDTYVSLGTFAASVRAVVSAESGVTVDRSVRDLDVWIDDVDGVVSAGDRVTIDECRDMSLLDKTGTVLTVNRDALATVRRCVVRMGNDA